MAEIDKALPNIKKSTIELPGEDKITEAIAQQINQEQEAPDNIEIIQTEEGGAEVSFDPSKAMAEGSENHFANLAEYLEDDVLGPLGSELKGMYLDYKSSRKDWEESYTKGLDLLGFKYEDRGEPFQGASGATHPVLAEAVTQFQSLAYKELLPASGPVRTQIIGAPSSAKEQQSERVKEFMNYQLMSEMREYEQEFDQMLFYLPLSGSTFKKVYYDELLGRAVSKFVPADDLLVPYSATSLEDADSIIHKINISENDLKKQQVGGFYRDIELGDASDMDDSIAEKERELDGIRKADNSSDMYTLLECHVDLDLDGFQDENPDTGEATEIKLPYIVTIEEGSREVLSIRRNYEAQDPKKKRINYFTHFKFLPGLGFYGFGLIHMIGGLSRTATAALRQLLDAGTLSNLPSGFKTRGIRVRDEAQSIQPGEFRDVDAPGGNLREAFMPLPFKEPSGTLLQLMGVVVSAGQRFASIADMQVGDGNQGAAVGTTVALLERGSRVMSAIHKRLYNSLKNEFRQLVRIFSLYLPPEYPYDIVGGQRVIKKTDFDDRVDVLPIADPNIFSQTQRISLAQTQLQLAQTNPKIHNLYQAYRSMYEAIGVKNVDLILPPPAPPQPMDPSMEHIQSMAGKKFQAFPKQDHKAHIDAHLNFMGTSMVRNNPTIMSIVQKNILEHISLMAQEQIQIEFAEELVQLQQMQAQMQQQAMTGMPAQPNPMMEQLQVAIESRKSKLIAEMTKDFMEEERKINSAEDVDPLVKLKSREIELRAMENERKKDEGEQKLEIERAKLVQDQVTHDEKMEQNEDLAGLRAGVSLAKAGVSKMKVMTNN
ncbi:hypothetical protein [uncultured virus]|jgi:hypothetical protein|uniref:Portal protein n=1 Tax=uncultured virus TaxID=340016 RepID=A0A218MMJ8_9VIRU|nr:hypothetical protein [uncultured virus]